MADSQRIEDLRRRVQKDPASIAFAQLAEECRRAGRYQEAVEVCRAGLAIHPGYLSARVTLGRALIELSEPDEALHELTVVLKSAPENLAAIRGTAEIHHRRGALAEALAQYRAALALARNDPDLQQTVDEIARQIEPPPTPASADGLSLEQLTNEFLLIAPPPVVPAEPAPAAEAAPPPVVPAEPAPAAEAAPPPDVPVEPASAAQAAPPSADPEPAVPAPPPEESRARADTPPAIESLAVVPTRSDALVVVEPAAMTQSVIAGGTAGPPPEDDTARESGMRTIAALEQWLDAIHVTRAQRGA